MRAFEGFGKGLAVLGLALFYCAICFVEPAVWAQSGVSKGDSARTLEKRQKELKDREEEIRQREERLNSLKAEVEKKIDEYTKLLAQIEKILGQIDKAREESLDHTVRAFEAMPPDDAAARLALLDDRLAARMLSRMKSKKAAAIMASMEPQKAAVLTQSLVSTEKKIPTK